MTIRRALIFYLGIITIAIVGAWALAFLYDWQAGMILLTVVLLEHAWRWVKIIRRWVKIIRRNRS